MSVSGRTLILALSVLLLAACGQKKGSPLVGEASVTPKTGSPPGNGIIPAAAGPLCYQGTIATIIQNNCLSCHNANGHALPTLTSYNQVVAVKGTMLFDVQNNHMPPGGNWSSAADKADLIAWLSLQNPPDACATATPSPTPPPGSPTPTPSPTATPSPSPTPPPGLPRVDRELLSIPVTLQPDEFGDVMYAETLPLGLNPHRYYFITGVQTEAIETVSGKVSPLLHHLLVLKGKPGAPASPPQGMGVGNPGPGEGGSHGGHGGGPSSGTAAFFQWVLNSPFFDKLAVGLVGKQMNLFGGYVKGNSLFLTKPGTGLMLKGNDTFQLSVHFNSLFAPAATTKDVRIRLRIMMAKSIEHLTYFSLQVDPRWIADPMTMMIPAGNPSVSYNYTINPWDWVPSTSSQLDLEGVLYHMHNRGKAGRTNLIQPTKIATVNTQLNYSYANQIFNRLATPLTLTRDRDRLNVQCTWDNSQANQPFVNGVQLPTTDVMWGESTLDEMCMWVFPFSERGSAGIPSPYGLSFPDLLSNGMLDY